MNASVRTWYAFRWAQCLVNILVLAVLFGGAFFALVGQYWFMPAVSKLEISTAQPEWRRGDLSRYIALVKKNRDCRLTVTHHYKPVGEPEIEVAAPSLERITRTGIFVRRGFFAEPPVFLPVGPADFWATVRYYCLPFAPQTYTTNKLKVTIK